MKQVLVGVILFLCLLICGCDGKAADLRYHPAADTMHLETAAVGLVQYGGKTVTVHSGGITSYDCETAETKTAALPISEEVILNLFEDVLYIFDKTTNTMYTVSPESFAVEKEEVLQITDARILLGAVGKTYYIFYAVLSDEMGFLLVNRESGVITQVKSRHEIWGMASMTGDRILMSIGAVSTDKACLAVYHMKDNTYEEQRYYTNSLSVIQIAYNKDRHAAVYTVRDGYDYTTYTLSLEDGTIETVNMFRDETVPAHITASAGNLTVLCRGGTTLLYTDIDDDSSSITVAGVTTAAGYYLDELTERFSHETGILVKEQRYADIEKFNLAMMAGTMDADILVISDLMTTADYVRNEVYEDLWRFPEFVGLSQEKTDFLRFLAQTDDGALFGLPVNVMRRDSESTYLAVLLTRYFHENVDLVKQEYRDPDGSALHTLLDTYYAYRENGGIPPADAKLYTEYRSSFYMIYADSQKKEQAASFLAFLHDCLSGDVPLGEFDGYMDLYPKDIDEERSFVYWKSYDGEKFRVIMYAVNDILENPDIRDAKIAEAAAALKMMIME